VPRQSENDSNSKPRTVTDATYARPDTGSEATSAKVGSEQKENDHSASPNPEEAQISRFAGPIGADKPNIGL
jgi:hypothetical protein